MSLSQSLPFTGFPRMDRIRSVSRIMRFACLIAAALLPIALAALWLTPGSSPVFDGIDSATVTENLTFLKRALVFALALIPTALAVMALLRLSRVFAGYAAGRVFTQDAIDGLRATAWFAVWATAARIAVTPLVSVALTYDNAPGQRMVTLAISSDNIFGFVFALTLLVIAWVMSEARRIADDLNQIV